MSARRKAKKVKQKFQFTLIVDRLDLGKPNLNPTLGIQWSRGGRTALSSYQSAKRGVIDWGHEQLTLVGTMYKNTSSQSYEKKRSKIALRQQLPGKKKGKEKRVGVVQLYLNDFVGMDVEHTLELPVERCRSSDNAVLYVTLRCVWLKPLDQDDDNVSVSGLSMISSGTMGDTFEIQDNMEDSGEPNPDIDDKDIANMNDLDCFDLPDMPHEPPSQSQQDCIQGDVFNVRMGSLEAENTSLRQECEELRRRLAISGDSGFSEEWQNLTSELKMTKIELDNVQISLEEQRNRHGSQIKRLKREMTILQSKGGQVEELRQLLHENENKISELIQERQQLDDELVDEKANSAELQIELGMLRKKHGVALTSLSDIREEFEQTSSRLKQQQIKYRDLMKTLHMSPNELSRTLGFCRSQADDLETTLMMVRKSWKDTSHILETQINAMNADLLDTKLRNQTLKEKLESAYKIVEKRNQEIEELSEHRLKMSEVLTKHEVKMAAKMVELVNANNLLQAAKAKVMNLQQELEEYRATGGEAGEDFHNFDVGELFPDQMLKDLGMDLGFGEQMI